jgi:hypothetical protein
MLLYGRRTGLLRSRTEQFGDLCVGQRLCLHRRQVFCGQDAARNNDVPVPKIRIVKAGLKKDIPDRKGLVHIEFNRLLHHGIVVGIEIGPITQYHAVIEDRGGNSRSADVLFIVGVRVVKGHGKGNPGRGVHAVRGGRWAIVAFGAAEHGKKSDNGGGQEEDFYFSHICNFKGERLLIDGDKIATFNSGIRKSSIEGLQIIGQTGFFTGQ